MDAMMDDSRFFAMLQKTNILAVKVIMTVDCSRKGRSVTNKREGFRLEIGYRGQSIEPIDQSDDSVYLCCICSRTFSLTAEYYRVDRITTSGTGMRSPMFSNEGVGPRPAFEKRSTASFSSGFCHSFGPQNTFCEPCDPPSSGTFSVRRRDRWNSDP